MLEMGAVTMIFFLNSTFFISRVWVWVGGKEGTQDVKYSGLNIRYFTCNRDENFARERLDAMNPRDESNV